MGEESTRPTKFLGLTLRQAVVLGVIAYALITGLFIAKNFNSASEVEPLSSANLVASLLGKANSALSNEENVLESVVDAEGEGGDGAGQLGSAVYHSSVVFGLNYEDMMAKFKIFIYPGKDHAFKALSNGQDAKGLMAHTEEYFMYQLYQSDFVTLDPERANLLLLPISIRSLVEDPEVGIEKLGKWLSRYVQGLRDDYPYWARTLGADHVVVTCDDLTGDGSRNVLELNKNAIQVACSPLGGNGLQAFFPHKDVAMPLVQTIRQPSASPAAPEAEGKRSTLVYYHGDTDAGSHYAALEVSWKSDSRFKFEPKGVEAVVHYQRLSTSKFCLILGPQDYPDIVGALKYGCVPVLVSDGKLYDLPFQDILNWSQFTIILSAKNAKNIRSMLNEVDDRQYAAMQFLGKEASKHMEWHDPPVERDAFYLVLYDLWIRRHSIRYVRREEL
ncbi:unnamed protein product [Calypogeia fissa]